MDLPEAKRARREPRLDAVAVMLKWLTAAGATGLDSINVHATPDGGVGVASGEAGIAPGETIASIPATCVMSVGRSATSAVGGACNALPTPPSPEYVLWLDMALGRRDESHEFYAYLAALPRDAPDVASWTAEELASLAGTDVGAAAMAAEDALVTEHERVQALLAVWKSTSASGAPENSSISSFSAKTGRPGSVERRGTGIAHAIEQASRRWR